MRLIDAEDVKKRADCYPPQIRNVVANILRHTKTVKPEQKRGKWMFSSDHAEGICTICQYKIYGRPYQGNYLIVPYNFCPNCGAKMDDDDIPMEYFENGGI